MEVFRFFFFVVPSSRLVQASSSGFGSRSVALSSAFFVLVFVFGFLNTPPKKTN